MLVSVIIIIIILIIIIIIIIVVIIILIMGGIRYLILVQETEMVIAIPQVHVNYILEVPSFQSLV